ncbi:putative folylpolyglutamate synthase isoform X3 [Gigantopelta aegis]|uniref:putative folylpolyglutamate synthase isoform X3 n=1 Tax=Gigantopelta aegis TaxID=1735272 RepID=UPI001B88D60F|nr:putative folylpolyglutamate synthase isoform X3 [Gigantopelta aegis]
MDSEVKAGKPGRGSSSYQDVISIVKHLRLGDMADYVAYREHNVPLTIKALKCCGITLEDIDKLPIIHITGTKGKGSTSAFCESILRHSGYKTGFFSSPHMVKMNERFRIDDKPLSDEDFCSYFFDVYNKIEPILKDMHDRKFPRLFFFYTTMAFTVFIKEKVDVAVVEVGCGGQFDCTNVIRSPVVCGVTSLGLDHFDRLGDTIEKIAWHKAGIFKKGVPALTVSHPPEADAVLFERSQEIGAPLYRVPTLHEFCAAGQQIRLGIEGNVQFVNAGLALHLCRVFIHRINKENQYVYDVWSVPSVKDIPMLAVYQLSPGETEGLARCSWPGRTQTICRPRLTYFLDGAEIEHKSQYVYDVWSVPSVKDVPMLPVYQLSPDEIQGLARCSWPGRTQTICRPRLTYFLDGAEIEHSMRPCVQWFSEKSEKDAATIKGRVGKILFFGLSDKENVADMLSLLKTINFDAVVTCPSLTVYDLDEKSPGESRDILMKGCEEFKMTWDSLCALQGSDSIRPVTGGTMPSEYTMTTPPRHGDAKKSSSRMNTENVTNSGNCPSYAFPSHLQALHWATQGRESKLSHVANSDLYSVPERLKDADHIQVLVTGSLSLVAAVYRFLSSEHPY